MSRRDFEAAIEAVLFVSGEPVAVDRLLGLFETGEREQAVESLERLRERYRSDENRGIFLEEVAGGLRIVTAPEVNPYLRRFFEAAGGNRLSMAALETLAIVAYRQPVTGPEIQELRGRNPTAALRTLLDRRMLRITGRKEVVGRPFVYATTREFLMHFGLRDLSELPPLEEFEEMFGSAEDDFPSRIAHDHETIGLVSADEAEQVLGVEGFDVRAPSVDRPGSGETAGGADDGSPGEEESGPVGAGSEAGKGGHAAVSQTTDPEGS